MTPVMKLHWLPVIVSSTCNLKCSKFSLGRLTFGNHSSNWSQYKPLVRTLQLRSKAVHFEVVWWGKEKTYLSVYAPNFVSEICINIRDYSFWVDIIKFCRPYSLWIFGNISKTRLPFEMTFSEMSFIGFTPKSKDTFLATEDFWLLWAKASKGQL